MQPVKYQIAVPFDDRQQIVEVVSNSASKLSDRFHLLCLTKLIFELLLLRLIVLQCPAHAIKGTRYVCYFVGTVGLQRVREITPFERVDSFIKRRKGAHELV